MNKLEYHYFTTPNRLIDLSNAHQLLTLPKERQTDIAYLLSKMHNATYKVVFSKLSNFNLIKSLDLTSNLYEVQGKQKHVTLNLGVQFAKPRA